MQLLGPGQVGGIPFDERVIGISKAFDQQKYMGDSSHDASFDGREESIMDLRRHEILVHIHTLASPACDLQPCKGVRNDPSSGSTSCATTLGLLLGGLGGQD